MKLTAKQTQTQTIADLYRSIDRQHAITVTFVDADGTESIRTIEPYEIRTTTAGRIQVRAMCRLRGEARSFYVDAIRSYTLHRIGFVLDRPEPTTYQRPAPQPADDAQALIHYELARDKDDADYRPRVRLAA